MNNALIFVLGVKLNILFNDTLQVYWMWTKALEHILPLQDLASTNIGS